MSNTVQFLVQGSEPSPYHVSFEKRGDDLVAFCTCAAGENGQFCKHRLRILAGEYTDIVSGNEAQLGEVIKWLKGSKLEAALKELDAKEKEAEKLKKEIVGLKKKVASTMMA